MPSEERAQPDGETLRRALELAGGLLGNGPSDNSGQTEGSGPDLAKILEAMMTQKEDAPAGPESQPESAADHSGNPRWRRNA